MDFFDGKKGVFFDLYGTLLLYGDMKSAWSDWAAAFMSRLRPLGLSLSREAFFKECGDFLKEELPAAGEDALTPFERRIFRFCERLDLLLGRSDVADIADDIVEVWEDYVTLDPEALPVLETLEGGKSLALVSNFDHPRHFEKVIARHGLSPFFRSTVVSGIVGFRKPDPRIFDKALRETGLMPSEVVYVGDTEDDIMGARAAGIAPILIERPENPTDETALDFTDDDDEKAFRPGYEKGATKIAHLRDLIGLVV
jgi:HAD superfamily hydrolase (TIGR01549 family)